jgi:hypothetical protein
MNPTFNALFDEPEKRYLSADDLNLLSQYVGSLPERITVYRQLRTDEVAVMQPVADALQVQFPDVSEEMLKRALQNGMLALRYAAMAMLMDTPTFVTKRLQTWLPEMVAAYGTGDIDQALHQLLQKQLTRRLTGEQWALLSPALAAATALLDPTASAAESEAPLAGVL